MKKLVFLLSVLSLAACTENDYNPISEKFFAGKWYISATAENNGAKQNYTDACATNRDYTEFLENHSANAVIYNPDCELTTEAASWSLYNDTLTVTPSSDLLPTMKYSVQKLSAHELILKNNVTNVEGISSEQTYFEKN